MKSSTKMPERRSPHTGGGVVPVLCNILGTAIILAIVLTCLPLTLPRLFGYEIYSVVSPSMAPAIPAGSVVYVSVIQPEDVQEGDVIVFVSGGSVVTHRVVQNKVVEGEFVTRGDANAREDISAVPYHALIGRVAHHVPLVGSVSGLYSSLVGKLYALCLAACGIMFNMLAGRLRAGRRERLADEKTDEGA